MLDPNGKYDPHKGNFDGPDGYQNWNDIENEESNSKPPSGKLSGLGTVLVILGIICCFIPGGGWLLAVLLFYIAWVFS